MILSDVKGTLIENYGVSQSGAVYIRSDNDPEFVSKAVQKWLDVSGVDTL